MQNQHEFRDHDQVSPFEKWLYHSCGMGWNSWQTAHLDHATSRKIFAWYVWIVPFLCDFKPTFIHNFRRIPKTASGTFLFRNMSEPRAGQWSDNDANQKVRFGRRYYLQWHPGHTPGVGNDCRNEGWCCKFPMSALMLVIMLCYRLQGPVLPNPLTPDNMDQLTPEGAVSRLKYVGDAITLTRVRLNGSVPLFGFSGAPVR